MIKKTEVLNRKKYLCGSTKYQKGRGFHHGFKKKKKKKAYSKCTKST